MNDELAAQYKAVTEACGLWPDPSREVLVLSGEDRVRFLNGLVTCEVKDLAPGQGTRGFFTEVKGHILSDVVIRAADEHLWLELPGSSASDMVDHIQKYIVADRVEVAAAPDRKALVVLGPTASRVLAPAVQGERGSPAPWSSFTTDLDGRQVLVASDEHFGVTAWTLWTSAADLGGVQENLLGSASVDSIREVGLAAVEAVRIEKGIPRYGPDFGPDTLPQETGLDEAVSYDKGCYLGQEVVARLHYRGQIARCLRQLRSDAGVAPPGGSRLVLDDREAGVVTSAVASPVSVEVFALAMLQRRALEPGTRLLLEDGSWMKVV